MSEHKTTVVKNDWEKPELIVLVRTNPEEIILGNCYSSNDNNTLGIYYCRLVGCKE
jgi:hypothetical protein